VVRTTGVGTTLGVAHGVTALVEHPESTRELGVDPRSPLGGEA
jgi:hypothetical protein